MSLIFSTTTAYCGVVPGEGYEPEEQVRINRLNELCTQIADLGASDISRYVANNFLGKLWLNLLNKAMNNESPYTNLRTNLRTCSYNNVDIEYLRRDENFRATSMFNENTPDPVFNLNIVHVKRGLGIFDVIKDAAERSNMILLPRIQMHLTKDRHHKVAAYQTPHGVVVFTNQNVDGLMSKTLSCVWNQLTLHNIADTLREQDANENKFLRLCSCLYNNDIDTYEAILNELLAHYEAEQNNPERLQAEMQAFMTRIAKTQTNSIRTQISAVQNSIEDYVERMIGLQNTLRNYELDLLRFEILQEKDNKAMDALMAMVQRSNGNIHLVGPDPERDTFLIFDITTPINSYRLKDVEVFFKPNAASNMFTKHAKIALVVKKTFLEEEYQLMTKTRVSMDFSGRNGSQARKTIPNNNFIQNTHMLHFNCFSNARTASNKAVLAQDYIGGLAQLITACGTLTFTDGTVMTRLASELMANIDKKMFLEKATGNLMSINDIWNKNNSASTVTVQYNNGTTQTITEADMFAV